ncbi:hypothetical protein JR316_0010379 [Psilocybe cubensis]|uniref:Uncharacterized protein n=2 Tax=Psilocybe cubensis TaxID=181762 RepID=A0ACB8GM36_PSICU|nr:hypothetical protein JR316_0010379 [Psilocybe cubensis]KAH9476467.1 hypothetical protein JR316_0010379 [Psilocybe cubensis]
MDYAFELTQSLSNYMKAQIASRLWHAELPNQIRENFSAETMFECNLAVEVILQAFENQEYTMWDAEEYLTHLSARCTGQNFTVEARLKDKFSPVHSALQYQTLPGTVVDSAGNILVWYLPGILSETRVESVWNSLRDIETMIHKAVPLATSWRVNDSYFRHEPGWVQPGNINFSPAWFQQGHETSNPLEVSLDLCNPIGQEFIRDTTTSSALLGAILSIIHPEQYRAGMKFLQRLAAEPELVHKAEILKQILTIWSSPFGVMTVISNRDTPYHRDNGSCYSWYDFLMPLGKGEHGRLELPGLGLRYKYDPMTLVAITGRLLQHGAVCDGDRAVIVYYMRRTVFEELGVQEAGWSTTYDLFANLPATNAFDFEI